MCTVYVYDTCFMLQGHFTHYLDKSPVSLSAWNDPTQYHLTSHTSHVFINGIYESTNTMDRKLNYKQMQPELSIDKMCAAAITNHNNYRYPWMTIACDVVYDATFICQPPQTKSTVPGKILTNRTCDENWITLRGSDTCFSVLDIKNDISFHESQQVCASKNASVFKVNISDTKYSTWKTTELKKHFTYSLYKTFSYAVPEVFMNIDITRLQTVSFGTAYSSTCFGGQEFSVQTC